MRKKVMARLVSVMLTVVLDDNDADRMQIRICQ